MGSLGAALDLSGCATLTTSPNHSDAHLVSSLGGRGERSTLTTADGDLNDSREMTCRDAGVDFRGSIELVVCRVFGVRRLELRLSTRGRAKVALARQVSMYLAHVVFGLSLTEVGKIFERDRTTVSHACGVVEDRRDDPIFDRVLENLEFVIVAWAFRST